MIVDVHRSCPACLQPGVDLGGMADVGFVKVSTKLCNSTLFVIFCPSPRARVSLQAAHASEVGWNPAYFSTLSHELVRLMCQWSFE